MSLPVYTVVKPTDLNGKSNGKLNTELLTKMVHYPNTQSAYLHTLCARAMNALDGTVKDLYGETLTTTSRPDCYRNYDEQYSTFMKRYVTYDTGNSSKSCMGKTWWLLDGFAGAACPGNSNHGWGLARDTGYWLNGGVNYIGGAKCWPWLEQHAVDFGICWESQDEAWHIRYFTGDSLPTAVLAWEQGHTPTPIPPPSGGTYMVNAMRSDVYKGCPPGDMVKQCQFRLNMKGANPPLTIDGQPGTKTADAIGAFQAANGLTADKRCGNKTWTKLEA